MPYLNVCWHIDAMALFTVWAVIDHSLKWSTNIVMRLDRQQLQFWYKNMNK